MINMLHICCNILNKDMIIMCHLPRCNDIRYLQSKLMSDNVLSVNFDTHRVGERDENLGLRL